MQSIHAARCGPDGLLARWPCPPKQAEKKILLVEDGDNMARCIKRGLTQNGPYEVVIAHSCAEAFKVLRKWKPDHILLDFDLPDGNGGDVAVYVRTHPALAATPIVFITGLVRKEETRQRNWRIGGEIFLGKPVNMNRLLALL